MADGIHDGHRARMRQQFLQNDMDFFTSHQVLEMLLFNAIPRRDTNPLAHRLMDHFGSLFAVLEADYEQLMRVEGMTENAAFTLVFSGQLVRRYHREKAGEIRAFNDMSAIATYLRAEFLGETQEKLRIMCLNNRGELLACPVISSGSVTATSVNLRLIMETVLHYPTTAVVMAHNHPAGFAIPSEDDVRSTARVRQMLETVGIRLADHMVFAQDDYVSMRQSDLYRTVFSPYARDEGLPDWLNWE